MPNDGRLPHAESPGHRPDLPAAGAPCLALSATFTAEAIQPALTFWLRELGLGYDVRFAPYNQVFQQLLDPASLLARNSSGANVVLVRFEDWGAGAVQHAERLLDAVRHFAGPLIVAVCPATLEHEAASLRAEKVLRAGLAPVSSAYLVTPADLFALYPVDGVHDPHADELGHVPYTPLFFAALGTMLMRKLHAVRSTLYKVIALDCDDTLWQGICGEDGPLGVTLDPPRRALQEFMAAQRDSGMLLAHLQQEQRRGRGGDVPRASGDAAALRRLRGARASTGRRRAATWRPWRRNWTSRWTASSLSMTTRRSARRRSRAYRTCCPWHCPPMPGRSPRSCATCGRSTTRG